MVMGRDEWACVTKLHDPMRCLCVVGLIGCQHQLKEIKLVETGVLFRMNLIWVVAGFIGLLWLTQVLVRRGMDDGQ
jgi:hypothetical protein